MIAGARDVRAIRLDCRGAGEELCPVITEDTLTINVEGIGTYTLMWTPTGRGGEAMAYTPAEGLLGEAGMAEPLAMAVGFLFTEGIIDSVHDLRAVAFCPDDSKVVAVYLRDATRPQIRRRDVIMNSSCGVCGEGGRLEDLIATLPQVEGGMVVETGTLHRLMAEMRARQTVFAATGGAHAAAVFGGDGRILALAEDLGRHNSLDKVIGHCLLDGVDTAGCGVLLSSRLSLEMVTKAVRARFQLVAAVSAPTSLAVDVALRRGVTLCGFLREDRCTVYSHHQRIAELAPNAWLN
ncbi:MAG: formate dehydrogenase accessory sulfurtransferase FdhD [Magnetospirillum sp.]|nr:formate dehydrogenase accessory sulfurtransferase FdhD [Magnetospirillum sp.]